MRYAVRAIILRDDAILLMHRNKFGAEYYALPGGGVDANESFEQALVRELAEETSLRLTSFKLVFIEEPDTLFGQQCIYYCADPGGDVKLSEGSEEAAISKLGKNIYTPMWVKLTEIDALPFLSEAIKQAILDALKNGWPQKPKTLHPVVNMGYTNKTKN